MAVNFQRNLILQKIHDRNKKERDGYAPIISLNNRLFEDAENAKARIVEQTLEVEKLKQENVQLQIKAESGGSGGGGSGKAVDQRLLKLQEELTEMHRKKGENAQKIIDLNNAIQEKEKELHAKDERIRALMQELEQMQEKSRQQEQDNHELKTTNQILTDEQQALHLAFASLEEKFRKLQEDNNDLVTRWLQFKSKAADQMNAENDQVIKKREKVLQKQLEEAANEQKVVKEPALKVIETDSEYDSSEDSFEMEDNAMETEACLATRSTTIDHCYTREIAPRPVEIKPRVKESSNLTQETFRHNELTDSDLLELAFGNTSDKTKTATRWAVKQFKEWLTERGYSEDFEHLPASELDLRLRRFYGEVNNKVGKSYCKSSLVGIRCGINRWLQGPPFTRNINIMLDREFRIANKVLTGRIKKNNAKGLHAIKSHPPLSATDVAKLYSTGTLSNSNPESLQFKVFFELALTFGRRGRKGWSALKKENFVFIKNQTSGTEFVMLVESPGDPGNKYSQLVNTENKAKRMFSSTNNDNCPVNSLKLYLSKLSKREDAFFQRVRKGVDINKSDEWYISKLGHNSIAAFMKRISRAANLSRIYTNHCIFSKEVSTVIVCQQ